MWSAEDAVTRSRDVLLLLLRLAGEEHREEEYINALKSPRIREMTFGGASSFTPVVMIYNIFLIFIVVLHREALVWLFALFSRAEKERVRRRFLAFFWRDVDAARRMLRDRLYLPVLVIFAYELCAFTLELGENVGIIFYVAFSAWIYIGAIYGLIGKRFRLNRRLEISAEFAYKFICGYMQIIVDRGFLILILWTCKGCFDFAVSIPRQFPTFFDFQLGLRM